MIHLLGFIWVWSSFHGCLADIGGVGVDSDMSDGMSAGEHQRVFESDVGGGGDVDVGDVGVLTTIVVSVAADVMCCTIVVVVGVIAFIFLLVVGVKVSVMLRSLGVLHSPGCLCPCMVCVDHVIVGDLGVVVMVCFDAFVVLVVGVDTDRVVFVTVAAVRCR